MAKIKLNKSTVIKKQGSDTFIFKNGVAVVPGTLWKKQPMKITIQEYNEALAESKSDLGKSILSDMVGVLAHTSNESYPNR